MFDDVAWFPLCAGLSALGVIAAFFAFRRRGAASGLRLLGWAAIPMAVYLTGLIQLLWTIGTAIGRWVSAFVFDPFVWAGLALFAFTAIALPVAGVLRRRRAAAGGGGTPAVRSAPSPGRGEAAPKQVEKGTPRKTGDADPLQGMEDIEEILKRRGIT